MMKMAMGELTVSSRKLVMSCGMLSKLKSHDIAIEVAMRNITTAVVRALASSTPGKSATRSVP